MAREENQIEMKEEGADIAPFDPTKKKEKKKVAIQDPAGDSVEQLAEKTQSLSFSDALEPALLGLKKKKKKQVQNDLLDDEKENDVVDVENLLDDKKENDGVDVENLLDEEKENDGVGVENNPDLAKCRQRTVKRGLQVLREGPRKTVFVNFMDFCRIFHRPAEHVMTFLLAKLGTRGSLDGQQRLVVKGRFALTDFERILRPYLKEYVICNGCESPDTTLSEEGPLFCLRCEKCGSERSVVRIKAGFVAGVGRRKAGT